MKKVTTLVTAVSLALIAFNINAAEPVKAPKQMTNGTQTTAQLAWRCGKNNPAMWGTFGNGCLKQKRNWGKQKLEVDSVKAVTTDQ